MNSMLCARTLPGLLMVSLIGPIAPAQTGANSNSFDVVSVKTGDPSFPGMSMHVSPSGISLTNVTLKFLIQYAWSVKKFQISGGPRWINSDLFTIHAKSDHGQNVDFDESHSETYRAFAERLHSRVRSLLADRFALRLHTEEREMPVYELVVAGSPKLSPAADGPEGLTSGPGKLKGTRAQAGAIASALSDATERVVIDRTGLNGYYDYTLTWTPDQAAGAAPQMSEQATSPSLFTAVREQLGLQLKAAKGPVQVLVIDYVEKPSAN